MAPDPLERWHELGGFIRDQRRNSRLSLRKLSDLAGISNPYLSQIERGLRKPSAEILQGIAKGLRISAETLYERAGLLEERPDGPDLVGEILRDITITEDHKDALVRIYRSFQAETASHRPSDRPIDPPTDQPVALGSGPVVPSNVDGDRASRNPPE